MERKTEPKPAGVGSSLEKGKQYAFIKGLCVRKKQLITKSDAKKGINQEGEKERSAVLNLPPEGNKSTHAHCPEWPTAL